MSINPRIISGIYKNRKLDVPESARPITDRVKQSLFDIIQEVIPQAKVLDAFAGSGNLGIEALSRGARHVTFLEPNEEARNVIQKNIRALGISSDTVNLSHMKYETFVKSTKEQFDILFLDPPFVQQSDLNLQVLKNVMKSHATVIYKIETQRRSELQLPDFLQIVIEKKIGSNTLLFLQMIDPSV